MFKKISPVLIVGFILTVVCIASYVKGFEFIQAVTNYSYDLLIRQTHEAPKSGKVVIVDIDDESINSIGQWPWSRYVVAEMTAKILSGGASVVVFDVVFPEQDRTSPMVYKQSLKKGLDIDVPLKEVPEDYQDFDAIFASVLAQGNTVLGSLMSPTDRILPNYNYETDKLYKEICVLKKETSDCVMDEAYLCASNLAKSAEMVLSIDQLRASSRTAFFNAVPDDDSKCRSNPLIWAYGKRIYPSLSLMAVLLDKGLKKCSVYYDDYGVTRISFLGDKINPIPTDGSGRLLINYRSLQEDAEKGFFSSFPTYKVHAVMTNTEENISAMFNEKIVFIGTSAAGLKDLRATPLTQYFSGVEVHATIVDNILSGDMLSFPSWMPGVNVISILIAGIFITVLIDRGRSWLCFLVSLIVIAAFVMMSFLLIKLHSFVFVPSWAIISIAIIYPTLTMIRFWQEEHQKKKVRNMFGTMVSKDVLRYLETNPESFSLSGKKAEATMMFSDVAGFTTISESLDPGKLSELLNRYLSPMTNIIMARKGYVDKYEGDAIMAEWGVPFPLPDHAVQACHAALEQQAKLAEIRAELKAQFGHELYVRMGINSGHVTAGNMGSEGRFQYTVMGDAVNLSARLEPANKDYGTDIMIGENTYALVKDQFITRQLDLIVVKGKTKPVAIYELIAVKGGCSEEKMKVLEFYGQGLKLHWERKWDDSVEAFSQALKLDANDKPSINMLKRVMYYQQMPPGDMWAGEFVRFSKD